MTIVFRVLVLWLVMETASADAFYELGKWFDAGQTATFEEVQGTWAGRCFDEEYTDRPIAAIVEFFSSERSQRGPAFDGKQVNKAIVHMDSEVEPDFYDSGASSLKDTSSLFSWINLETCSSDLCLFGTNRNMVIRKHGDYLVSRGHLDSVAIKCYYFRPESGD